MFKNGIYGMRCVDRRRQFYIGIGIKKLLNKAKLFEDDELEKLRFWVLSIYYNYKSKLRGKSKLQKIFF
jgi:hypothetical protein